MEKKLNFREITIIASMTFGLFFGAGNLIFPIFLGQQAGANVWPAVIGFLVTGVGLPLLGIVAMGLSRSNGLNELASKIHPYYSLFFTIALYLTIGPFFAVPRLATVPFTVGITPLIGPSQLKLALFLFSLVFLAFVLWFSLRPSKILTWVGKILNPLFLAMLAVLVLASLFFPIAGIQNMAATGAYQNTAFIKGFLEGYNTMDALASLAFGIIIISVIKDLGAKKPGVVALNVVKAGVFSMMVMALIYIALALIGATWKQTLPNVTNGGRIYSALATHYFGKIGLFLLASTITVACLKTAIGLITACGETFVALFPNSVGYKTIATVFCVISFAIANFGLDKIIQLTIPVLMLLYPLAITLILLALFDRLFQGDKIVYQMTTIFTLPAAIFDFINSLPANVNAALHLKSVLNFASHYLPFFSVGLGWLVPATLGFLIGFALHLARRKQSVSFSNE
jgi:LIVCS family branched-chain amino acid:cation transporter